MTTTAAADELLDWLRTALPEGWIDSIDRDDEDGFKAARTRLDDNQFLKDIGAEGWAMPQWSRANGGRGIDDPAELRAVDELKNRYRIPRSFNILGFGLAAPTILQWGTEEQQAYFLPRMAQGDWWCQLFSEPTNGSDVAGLGTRAVRDGDEWIVNGQKVWTSGAQISRWGMLIARTSPDQPKHKGITYFVMDMKAPGVEVRPLRQITGDAEFNEVFMNDVRIPDAWRIGAEGEGWAVAQTTLMNERVALSGAFGPGGGAAARRPGGGGGQAPQNPITTLLVTAQLRGDKVLEDRVARLLSQGRSMTYTMQRAIGARRAGGQPGPEGSITKVFGTEYNQRLQNTIIDAAGMHGVAWLPDDGAAALRARAFLRSRGNTIEGGTSEIQRNILGDRVLGLPREPDVSRDLPWKDVPRS
jgi:alkylation response protein AidB-like acyl-CoA dehydrogenase